ncbi:MAG: epoxyqueuosine reductase [Phenylobacterium sp.]|jgi:epoxyqueuosine reductase
MTSTVVNPPNYHQLAAKIKLWGKELGFEQVGISDVDLSQHESYLQHWLDAGFHGEMDYMAAHGMKRARPTELLPGTLSVISVRMDYLPPNAAFAKTLKDKHTAYISRYALGRDYHKVLRNRLKKLAQKIETLGDIKELGYRPFVDSAPVLERQLAEKAGLGWTGKHSLLINKSAGSWFFLAELLVNIPLPVDQPVEENCGHCVACIKICPTQAIVAPYVVDGRRCISYLTIELKGAIPQEFRPLIGNRIYGCDDCQLVCPWNRYAQLSSEGDFTPRAHITDQKLITLFSWDEATFLRHTEGSPIRRIGHASWQRNIAVAMGNAPYDAQIVQSLTACPSDNEMVMEHIEWALAQQKQKQRHGEKEQRLTRRLISTIEKGLPRDA